MKQWLPALGGVLTLATVATLTPSSAQQNQETVTWRSDFVIARTEANRQNKPLFVVFRCER